MHGSVYEYEHDGTELTEVDDVMMFSLSFHLDEIDPSSYTYQSPASIKYPVNNLPKINRNNVELYAKARDHQQARAQD